MPREGVAVVDLDVLRPRGPLEALPANRHAVAFPRKNRATSRAKKKAGKSTSIIDPRKEKKGLSTLSTDRDSA